MTLSEKYVKEIANHIEKKQYYDASCLLLRTYNLVNPISYSYLLNQLLISLCLSLANKNAYLTPRTYEVVAKLPIIVTDDYDPSFMQRTNRLYKIVKETAKKKSQYELQFK